MRAANLYLPKVINTAHQILITLVITIGENINSADLASCNHLG